jgi:hypothetical protein
VRAYYVPSARAEVRVTRCVQCTPIRSVRLQPRTSDPFECAHYSGTERKALAVIAAHKALRKRTKRSLVDHAHVVPLQAYPSRSCPRLGEYSVHDRMETLVASLGQIDIAHFGYDDGSFAARRMRCKLLILSPDFAARCAIPRRAAFLSACNVCERRRSAFVSMHFVPLESEIVSLPSEQPSAHMGRTGKSKRSPR